MLARRHNSHKGSYGSVAVVGGANGMGRRGAAGGAGSAVDGHRQGFCRFSGAAPPLDGHYLS